MRPRSRRYSVDPKTSTMLRVATLLATLQAALAAEYLLPSGVAPVHYEVTLLYDIDPATNYSYFGNVDILVTAKHSTSQIVLHAQDYDIATDKVKLSTSSGRTITVSKVQLNDTYNFLTLSLRETLLAGQNYTLTIPFTGNLRNGLDGVYISNYVNKKTNEQEHLIATQFEAISARKGFPCFDEPLYKATFRMSIGHHRNYTAIANMPLANTSDENALEKTWSWATVAKKFKKDQSQFVWEHFYNSVPMSTYLVAWVVSKFAAVESPAGLSNTKFKIWARADAIDQAEYASITGPKVLSYFEKWFGVDFPLPKQDMVAIPDFSAGAMENWGLITYRETALLYDKEESSFLNKERVAEVIAHELAHQWFGNLVTMKWWSDLWLNEGFATFAASVGVAAVEPTWHAEEGYAVDNILSVLALDALEASHPVSVPIDDPKRISEIFDEISYRKGSALIRMMTMFLGDDIFRKAISNYLKKHSYHNAEQDDLWQELTLVTEAHEGLTRNVSVKTIMDTWTKQTGYPLLTVTRDYSGKELTITQKRYLNDGVPTGASWWVPLSVRCEREGAARAPVEWLAAHEGVAAAHRYEHGSAPDEWVLFNAHMIAPIRVNYDERNWRLLAQTVNSERYTDVPVLSRVQLLSDALALAWTNVLDYDTALQIVLYLNRETDHLAISTGLAGLAKIENVLKRTPDYGAFQRFVRGLIADTYRRVGGLAQKTIVNGDDLNSVKLQVLTSGWACRMKVPGCEENAIELFQRWMDSDTPDEDNPIPLDLRRTVYCVAISRGSVAHWRFLLARKQRANVAAASDAILRALACTREVWILSQYLEWAVTDNSEVRRQDAAAVISSVARSAVGFYVARDFIYNRIEDISRAFHGQGRRVGQLIKALLDQFTTQQELDEFNVWRVANKKYLDDAKLAVNQAIEKAQVNIAWMNKNRKRVVAKMREFTNSQIMMEEAAERRNFVELIQTIHEMSGARLKSSEVDLKPDSSEMNRLKIGSVIMCILVWIIL